MCGRFASTLAPELLARLFATRNALPNLGPNWNAAPSQAALVVRRHPDTRERNLDTLKWGLLPSWTKDAATARRPSNARSETVAKLPSFRGACAKRRAIVPVEAFYEWRRRGGQPKQPFAIARADGSLLALAGLREGYRWPTGEVTRTFSVLTTTASRLMQGVHDRIRPRRLSATVPAMAIADITTDLQGQVDRLELAMQQLAVVKVARNAVFDAERGHSCG